MMHNCTNSVYKETRHFAPNWRLRVVVGAFTLRSNAIDFAQELVNSTRGSRSKRDRAIRMAERYGMKCYTDCSVAPGGTLAFLRRNAPQYVVTTYLNMKQRGKEVEREKEEVEMVEEVETEKVNDTH